MRRGKNIAKRGGAKGFKDLKGLKGFFLLLCCLLSYPAFAQKDIDTLMRVSSSAIDHVIKYSARDSVAMDLTLRRAFLYSDGSIDYDSMLLRADHV